MTTAYGPETEDDFRLGKALTQKKTITETGKIYISTRVGYNTSIQINKAGSTATLKGTTDFERGADVDDAVFSTINLSEGTDDYQKGHSAGLTGFELDCTIYSADIVLIVTYYKAQ